MKLAEQYSQKTVETLKNTEDFKKVIKEIENHVALGLFECILSKNIGNDIKELLRREGFSVLMMDDLVLIKW